MLVFLNGRFVPEEQAVVSVFDRGFLYGDGLFETLRVFNGKPFRWNQHLERLRLGAEFLKIKSPFAAEALRAFAGELIVKNQMPDSLLRLTLSRGVGVRGYSPKRAENPTVVMSLHPAPRAPASGPAPPGSFPRHAGSETGAPPAWKVITSSFRLPSGEPLSQFKTCNKLPQILARAEADAAGADEALLLNTEGLVVEAAGSNLLWIEGDTVCTPSVASGILPGVTRAAAIEICRSLGVKCRESGVASEKLKRSEGIFLSLSSWGVVAAKSLDGEELEQSPLIGQLRLAYWDLVRSETA
jgi:branched-subunit amino acid aminotransferase/4-amino-4-deoxychorismate lyase